MVLEFTRVQKNHSKYLCKCDCGTIKEIMSSSLTLGRTTSCGCYSREMSKKRPCNFQTHGLSKKNERLFTIWVSMRGRCFNKENQDYKRWGARGITVCDEWLNYENFYYWAIENGYADNLSIDRIDNDGNYEPLNCRWSTKKDQANNRRNNRYITINGETKTLSQWYDICDIDRNTVQSRVYYLKWDYVKALTTPPRKKEKRQGV